MDKLRVLDLFSGIGGFSLGLERAGMETVAFCEIDPYCRAVLWKHWPGIPIHDDVRKLTSSDVGTVNVVSAGFPCQPYSIAGKRLGGEDDRALWPETVRIIKEFGADWFIGENVTGIIDMALDGVLADLESAGYTVRTFDIPACVVGLPTLERHIWIIAQANRLGCKGSKRDQMEEFSSIPWKLSGSYQRERERWKIPSSRVCRSDQRIPNRVDRNKALGNAVSPEIPEIIGSAIIDSYRSTITA